MLWPRFVPFAIGNGTRYLVNLLLFSYLIHSNYFDATSFFISCFISAQRPGVGNSFPAFNSLLELNTSRISVCALISSSLKIKRISSFFSIPTPCSPVIELPTSAHALRHALPALIALSVSPIKIGQHRFLCLGVFQDSNRYFCNNTKCSFRTC